MEKNSEVSEQSFTGGKALMQCAKLSFIFINEGK